MKVLVFPKEPNPYQSLLYGAMAGDITISYLQPASASKLQAALFIPRLFSGLALYRARGFKLLHIHWMFTLAAPQYLPFHKQISYLITRLFLVVVRLLRYKIVWTVHNVLPHGAITSNDLQVRRILSTMASVKIVHSPSTLAELAAKGIDNTRYTIIPHGNYIGVYDNNIDMAASRTRLHIPLDAKVLGFVGSINPYKDLPNLIKVFSRVTIQCPEALLLVAGSCPNPILRKSLEAAVRQYPDHIRLHIGFIPDNDLQLYLNASDVITLPFNEITTSGSALLAASFGKPLIAPRIGSLADIPTDSGLFYDPKDTNGLYDSIVAFTSGTFNHVISGKLMYRYARSLDWTELAARTVEAYRQA